MKDKDLGLEKPEVQTTQVDRPSITPKRYKCDRCEHESVQSTNHYGSTWSFGHFNTCPKCPPWAKYPEFGGSTTWTCIEAN